MAHLEGGLLSVLGAVLVRQMGAFQYTLSDYTFKN